MCRLFAFRSKVLSRVHQSLLNSENSLMNKSYKHKDGWGLAFYQGAFPHIIRSDDSAMDSRLFAEVSSVMSTRLLIAHVRLATLGTKSVLNSHPFQYGNWVMAHNGEVSHYGRDEEVTRTLDAKLDPRFAASILGTTDSEVLFHIFLSKLKSITEDIFNPSLPMEPILAALQGTVQEVHEVCGGTEMLNIVLSNGSALIGYRHNKELFFSTHKSKCPERRICPSFNLSMCENPANLNGDVGEGSEVRHLIIASETPQAEARKRDFNVWRELKNGEYVAVDEDMICSSGTLLSPSCFASPTNVLTNIEQADCMQGMSNEEEGEELVPMMEALEPIDATLNQAATDRQRVHAVASKAGKP